MPPLLQIAPTNKPVAREDFNDVVFRNVAGKWKAVTTEISRMHKTGRPVLVGTTSVETSELVSKFLSDAGITHEVLNAKPENVERESEIVAQSGRRSAVTIATNMAGRGTDIILGGNAEFMARLKLREFLFPQVCRLEHYVYAVSVACAYVGNARDVALKKRGHGRVITHAHCACLATLMPD